MSPFALAPITLSAFTPITEAPARGPSRLALFVAILAIALLLGLIEAGQAWIREANIGRPMSFGEAIYRTMPSWLILAALAPGIIVLARRFPLERGIRSASIPLHAVAAVVFAGVHLGGTALVYALRDSAMGKLPLMASKFLTLYFVADFLTYWAIVGAWHALHYYRELRARELAASRLQASLTEARLQALRTQLNPHFLFNTLNAISTMALKGDREDVVQTLGALSDLLRQTLDESIPQEIPLSRELELLERYLEIQRLRFADRLSVEIEVEAGALDQLVPSMIMQPLVENALVHGIAKRPGPGCVSISATRTNGRLRVEVSDTGPGFSASADTGGGIGLANTRARLEQLYGDAYTLEWGNTPERGSGAFVALTLPARAPHRDQ